MQNCPPCTMLKKTLTLAFLYLALPTVNFVCVLQIPNALTTRFVMAHVGDTSVSQNKQAELELSRASSHLHPHFSLLSCLMTEAGGMVSVALLRQDVLLRKNVLNELEIPCGHERVIKYPLSWARSGNLSVHSEFYIVYSGNVLLEGQMVFPFNGWQEKDTI